MRLGDLPKCTRANELFESGSIEECIEFMLSPHMQFQQARKLSNCVAFRQKCPEAGAP